MEAFAYESHQRAIRAIDEGRFERGDGAGPDALARAMLDRAPESIRALFDA